MPPPTIDFDHDARRSCQSRVTVSPELRGQFGGHLFAQGRDKAEQCQVSMLPAQQPPTRRPGPTVPSAREATISMDACLRDASPARRGAQHQSELLMMPAHCHHLRPGPSRPTPSAACGPSRWQCLEPGHGGVFAVLGDAQPLGPGGLVCKRVDRRSGQPPGKTGNINGPLSTPRALWVGSVPEVQH